MEEASIINFRYNIGDIWMWTKNSHDHPDDPEYNYFLIVDNEWGYKVIYLKDGSITHYTSDTFHDNTEYLVKVA